MSNRVYFQTTRFIDTDNDLQEAEYGYRLFDDYESVYNDGLAEEELPTTAKGALELIKSHDGLHESVTLKGSFYFNGSCVEVNDDGEIEEE